MAASLAHRIVQTVEPKVFIQHAHVQFACMRLLFVINLVFAHTDHWRALTHQRSRFSEFDAFDEVLSLDATFEVISLDIHYSVSFKIFLQKLFHFLDFCFFFLWLRLIEAVLERQECVIEVNWVVLDSFLDIFCGSFLVPPKLIVVLVCLSALFRLVNHISHNDEHKG